MYRSSEQNYTKQGLTKDKEEIKKCVAVVAKGEPDDIENNSEAVYKMPCLTLCTNVSLDGVDTSSILSEAISTVAKIMGRPESYVMVALEGSMPMSFGGTEEPAAYGELVSIGALNPDLNKKLSAAVAFVLETKLSVPKSRFFLKFYDIEGYNCGLNGSIMVIESK